MNLAKYRKAQSDLDEAEERLAENAVELSTRSRLKNAMSVTTTRAGGGVCLIHPFIHSFVYYAALPLEGRVMHCNPSVCPVLTPNSRTHISNKKDLYRQRNVRQFLQSA